MAKKVKFPLEMADGAQVRNIDELKEHFDIEKVVGYFTDGRLLNWLQSRYYEDEADKVEQLTANDSQLHKKLCEIFGVESAEEVDPEEIARRQERLNRLKQYTDDREIWNLVDQVAFDQEDLGDLLDEDATLIYLCNNRFTIPLRVTDKNYVGIGKAVAVIRSNKFVDFDALNIKFKGVRFDDDYSAIIKAQHSTDEAEDGGDDSSRAEKFYNEGEVAKEAKDYDTAIKKYKQAADLGYTSAFELIGRMYYFGQGVDKDIDEARRWFKLGMDKEDGNSFGGYAVTIVYDQNATNSEKREAFRCMKRATELDPDDGFWWYQLGMMYHDNYGTYINLAKAYDCFKQGHKLGDSYATNELGIMFGKGEHVKQNSRQAFDFFKKAVELDEQNITAVENLAYCYREGEGVDKNSTKAFELYERAAEAGSAGAMNELGDMYFFGKGTKENRSKAFQWYLRAAQNGDFDGMANVGTCYIYGDGTSQDTYEGERWLKKSAEGGNLDGMYFYGNWLYDQGNTRAGINWLEQAANQGVEVAQNKLAEIRNKTQRSSYSSSQSSGGVWEATTMIINRQGVHARPASIFVQKADAFKSKVQLKAKGKTVNAKSILMIMSLGIEYGDKVTIVAEGSDARQAVNELVRLIDSGFGE